MTSSLTCGAVGVESMRPTWMEVASGRVIGEYHGDLPPLAEARVARRPREAFEASLLKAVSEPPCAIGFTGGRDSSALLAVAVRLADEHGLPRPIPVTLRFPGVPTSDESSWQEMLVDWLGVDDWHRVDVDVAGSELDLVGAKSRALFGRVGLLYPLNMLVFHRVFEAAAEVGSRSLVMGLEADGLFGRWQWPQGADLLSGRSRPSRRALTQVGGLLGPRAVRKRYAVRTMWSPPWMQPSMRRYFHDLQTDEVADAPLRWDHWVEWWSRRRYVAVLQWGLRQIENGVRGHFPFMDRGFLEALGRDGGPLGYGDRGAIMRALFADVLPVATVGRTTKAATFSQLCWSAPTREYVESWDGSGLDDTVVNTDALRQNWLSTWPDERSALLVLTSWLNQQVSPPAAEPPPAPPPPAPHVAVAS